MLLPKPSATCPRSAEDEAAPSWLPGSGRCGGAVSAERVPQRQWAEECTCICEVTNSILQLAACVRDSDCNDSNNHSSATESRSIAEDTQMPFAKSASCPHFWLSKLTKVNMHVEAGVFETHILCRT